jgi:hypothetical protein
MNLTLIDAFARFGAKPSNRLRGKSAMAADGALVLNCSLAYFGHPSRGVLRYEDKLSRQSPGCRDTELLGRHLALAAAGALPVRMVVSSRADENKGNGTPGCHVRPDLIGRVTAFDGDHFIVDFTRPEAVRPAAVSVRRR